MNGNRTKTPTPRHGLAVPLLLLAVLWGVSFWATPAHDPDLGWHLLGGSWILEHGAIPRHDIINAFRLEWHDYHWLAQIPLALLYRFGGYEALRIALGAWMVILFLSVIALVTRAKRGPIGWYSALVVVSAWFLMSEIVTVRPQLVALVLLAVALAVLVRRPAHGELPLLFVLTCLAVNIHVYWIFIPYLWFLYRVCPRIVRQHAPSAVYAWGGLFLLGSAGLVSPYGIFAPRLDFELVLSNYALLWDYLTMPEVLKSSINELRSTLASTSGVQIVVLLYLVVIARTARWRRFLADIGAGMAMITGLLLAVLGIKYVAVCAICCVPYLVRHPLRIAVGRSSLLPVASVALCALALFFGYRAVTTWPLTHPNNQLIDRFVPYTGCGALAALDIPRRPDRADLRILTHFNHGGWCRWALYEKERNRDFRVTTDNRTQGVPGEHYTRSFELFGVKGQWLRTLAEWAPDVAVVQKGYPLAQFMGLSPDRWRKVFEDEEFAIFLPR
jgi:hypothetical protein